MYKFTIEYYYERYQSGILNIDTTRTGVVLVKDKNEAVTKIQSIDNEYISIKNLKFEEIEKGGRSDG